MNLLRFLNIPEDHKINKRIGMATELEIAHDIAFFVEGGALSIRWEGETAEGGPQIFRLDLDIHMTEKLEKALARYRSGT
jgi:hypothetical protein